MGVIYNESQRIFHLQSVGMSYVIQVVKSGYLAHLYWGKRIRAAELGHLLQFVHRPSFSPKRSDHICEMGYEPEYDRDRFGDASS
jgi:alpha-galactosidase